MKRYLIGALIIIFPILVHAQTAELEIAALSKRVKSGELTTSDYTSLASEFNKLLKDYDYPILPFNSNDKVEYVFIDELNEISKQVIYKRILEWAAINYGSLNAVLHYDDFETGKIIVKGNFDVPYVEDYLGWFGVEKVGITSNTCYQTCIFTIKENKVKTIIKDIEFNYQTRNYSSGSYIPDRTIKIDLEEYFPISDNEQIDWRGIISMLNHTDDMLRSYNKRLEDYINDYENDYNF